MCGDPLSLLKGNKTMIETGIKNIKELICDEENTAKAVGSGDLRVFSTPAMLAAIELCAAESVKPFLEENQSTVGISANLKHIAATPVGMKIRCESELTDVDRRRLTFLVKVYDEKELVGECTHERFIVDNSKFIEKTYNKKG